MDNILMDMLQAFNNPQFGEIVEVINQMGKPENIVTDDNGRMYIIYTLIIFQIDTDGLNVEYRMEQS